MRTEARASDLPRTTQLVRGSDSFGSGSLAVPVCDLVRGRAEGRACPLQVPGPEKLT